MNIHEREEKVKSLLVLSQKVDYLSRNKLKTKQSSFQRRAFAFCLFTLKNAFNVANHWLRQQSFNLFSWHWSIFLDLTWHDIISSPVPLIATPALYHHQSHKPWPTSLTPQLNMSWVWMAAAAGWLCSHLLCPWSINK